MSVVYDDVKRGGMHAKFWDDWFITHIFLLKQDKK